MNLLVIDSYLEQLVLPRQIVLYDETKVALVVATL